MSVDVHRNKGHRCVEHMNLWRLEVGVCTLRPTLHVFVSLPSPHRLCRATALLGLCCWAQAHFGPGYGFAEFVVPAPCVKARKELEQQQRQCAAALNEIALDLIANKNVIGSKADVTDQAAELQVWNLKTRGKSMSIDERLRSKSGGWGSLVPSAFWVGATSI
eukprot:scaffold55209_cov24-Tisochrysis_lutea.AAC.1